ncbi:MAG: hypothetical protein GX493_01325 [Firmicutes bacterium]|nr:hypothetical protein [Bacillota bacterium]
MAAVGLGYLGNSAIWRLLGSSGTIFLVPFWEEAVKTGLGFLVGRLIFVHAFFGLGEASLEFYRRRKIAAGLAFVTHLGFGFLTLFLWRASGSPVLGWLAASCLHFLWNWFVQRFGRG